MKIVRKLLVGLAGLIAILVVIGLFLPDSVHVERSTTVSASPAPIYELLSSFERFNEWSPWYSLDPHAEYVISNPAGGTGASFSWQSEKPGVGSGSQQIVETVENSLVRTRLDFGDHGIALAAYKIEPVGNGMTRVTWSMDADFGYDLVGRYAGLLFDKMTGGEYEKGLASLKALVESEQAYKPAIETEAAVPPGN